MKKAFLSIAALFLMIVLCGSAGAHRSKAAVQTPAITITFTCNVASPQCTELLRLSSATLGWTSESGLTRMQFLQREAARWLRIQAKERALFEAREAARSSTESSFDTTYPNNQ